MTREPMTRAAYAVAQADYARHQAGDELEFEQEMDTTLPEQLLLCQLDEAFQGFRASLDAIAATLPLQAMGNEGLAELMTAAVTDIAASRQAFIGRYVREDEG